MTIDIDITLSVFFISEIDSVSAIVDDKCRGKDPRLCDTGTCDPPTGKCVCPKKFNYVDLFQKCVPGIHFINFMMLCSIAYDAVKQCVSSKGRDFTLLNR